MADSVVPVPPSPGIDYHIRIRSPLIEVLSPALFTVFGLFLPAAQAVGFSPGFELTLSVLLLIVSGSLHLIDRQLERVRAAGFLVRARELFAVLVASALLIWAFVERPFPELVRGADFWIGIVAVAALFMFSSLLRRTFSARAFFVNAVLRAVTTKRPDSLAATSIAAATREFSIEAGEASNGASRSRHLLVFFIVWTIGVLVVEEWILGRADLVLEIGLIVTAVDLLFGLTILGRMEEDQRLMTEGIRPARQGASLKALMGGTLFVLLAGVALLAASRPALVSPERLSALLAWIAWLISLIPSPKPRPYTPPPVARSAAPPRAPMFDQLGRLPTGHTSELFARILTYLGWTLLGVVAAALLWILVSPLFRIDYRKSGPGALLNGVLLWAKGLIKGFSRYVRGLIEGVTQLGNAGNRSDSAGPSKRRTQARRETKRGRAGLMTLILGGGGRRFNRAFFRLVRWGEGQGVPFSRSMGPYEFVEKVGNRVPSLRDNLNTIGLLYEQQLFAPTPLGAAELAEYFKRIGEVVRRE
ncbi:MAG TPA: DUF4129 domain-containing protein [Spirochaetia bacterium]|nr:DUF4129 domain-containing protein [Spirochaetia bacterium]